MNKFPVSLLFLDLASLDKDDLDINCIARTRCRFSRRTASTSPEQVQERIAGRSPWLITNKVVIGEALCRAIPELRLISGPATALKQYRPASQPKRSGHSSLCAIARLWHPGSLRTFGRCLMAGADYAPFSNSIARQLKRR